MIMNPPGPGPMALPTDEAELRGLGVTRVTSEHFQVGPYLYSNLGEAIAQARRNRVAGNDL